MAWPEEGLAFSCVPEDTIMDICQQILSLKHLIQAKSKNH